ncbi:hypothetical protein PTKIN_Ptkin01aG0154100 [Pterospermum kingtungense]
MDNFRESTSGRKGKSKKKKNSNKPIKVVYISNPMKVKTSASKFRALVQELTGQDAEFPDPTKFTDTDTETDEDISGRNQTIPDAVENSTDDQAQEVSRVEEPPAGHHHHEKQYPPRAHDLGTPHETFDEVFTPQMLENFTGLLPPGLLL